MKNGGYFKPPKVEKNPPVDLKNGGYLKKGKRKGAKIRLSLKLENVGYLLKLENGGY